MIGFLVYVVMCSLGEMATWLPAAGGFSTYAGRFVDPALGFALGYTYWFKYIIITPNQLTAAALVIQYWLPADKVNPGVWIAIFLVVICAINYFGINEPLNLFRETELAAVDAIVRNGGALSHHHGIGKHRLAWLPQAVSPPAIAAIQGIKNALDPTNLFAVTNLQPSKNDVGSTFEA